MVKVIEKSIFKGIAGKRPTTKPKYYILHNDAGSMTPEQYISWLSNRYQNGQSELGFAHYYINRDCIARVEDTYNGTWSAANYDANMNSLSYEVCEQLKVSDEDFLKNESVVLMQMAEDMSFYGDTPNSSNIKFHNEFSSTSCPARSLALHGGTNESLRAYVITQVKHYQSLGKTVNEMLNKIPISKGWKKDSAGYWYETEKGQYYKNQFAQIEGIWYYFGETGYMYANQWLEYKTDEWYYFKSDGSMASDEIIKQGAKYYTFGKDGKLNEEKKNY